MGYADEPTTGKQLADANLFDFTRPIRLNYSSTSITGAPLLSYKDAELDRNFEGDAITRIQTAMGELVTVTLQVVADAFTRSFTLVVPTIRVAPGEQAEFDTVAIETTDRSGAFVPSPGPGGVLQTYQVYELQGTAQFVVS
jgi:hypothetical protein